MPRHTDRLAKLEVRLRLPVDEAEPYRLAAELHRLPRWLTLHEITVAQVALVPYNGDRSPGQEEAARNAARLGSETKARVRVSRRRSGAVASPAQGPRPYLNAFSLDFALS
jgi:hypothetical protein